MNCLECQELLRRRLDGEAPALTAEFHEHLVGCMACRQDHAAASQLLDTLKNAPAPVAPEYLTQSIVSAVIHDRAVRRKRMRARFSVTMALAASILFMVWAGYFWLPKPPGTKNDPIEIAKKQQPTDVSPPKDKRPTDDNKAQQQQQHIVVAKAEPLADRVDEATQVVAALTNRLAGQTVEQAKMFWVAAAPQEVPMGNIPIVEPEPLEPATQPLIDATDGMSGGISTVTRNAQRAVDYFRKELAFLDAGE